jgi:hypothetical protein
VAGIATRYGIDGPGFKPGWGKRFYLFQNGPGAHPAFYTMGNGSLSEG